MTVAEYLLAQNTCQNVVSSFAVGDIVRLGNTSIGFTEKRVSALGSTTTSGEAGGGATTFSATANISFESKFTLSTAFSQNLVSGSLTRKWEFYNNFEKSPGTSNWCNNVANNTDAFDELHLVVQDEDGAITGVKGSILESFGLSLIHI